MVSCQSWEIQACDQSLVAFETAVYNSTLEAYDVAVYLYLFLADGLEA